MICEPTATRKGKRPNGPGRPRIHPTRGPLACRSAGADAATPIPGDRRQPPRTATVRGGCPQGAIAAEGLQMAMSVRPCPGCSAVPAGIADAGLREQDRAEMVKCIRLCLDRTDICTATLGVVSPPDGSTTRPSPGRCWRPAWPSARGAATSARGTPGNAHSAARDMSGQLNAHARDEVDYAGCITTHLRRWGAARATLVRIR
jgi:hypothetical protein